MFDYHLGELEHRLTKDSKNVFDVWHKDYKEVDKDK